MSIKNHPVYVETIETLLQAEEMAVCEGYTDYIELMRAVKEFVERSIENASREKMRKEYANEMVFLQARYYEAEKLGYEETMHHLSMAIEEVEREIDALEASQ